MVLVRSEAACHGRCQWTGLLLDVSPRQSSLAHTSSLALRIIAATSPTQWRRRRSVGIAVQSGDQPHR
jgi:hypothetical protein